MIEEDKRDYCVIIKKKNSYSGFLLWWPVRGDILVVFTIILLKDHGSWYKSHRLFYLEQINTLLCIKTKLKDRKIGDHERGTKKCDSKIQR